MNKLSIVTGGTKGIGKAIIEKLAAEGFDIVTCARNEKDLASLTEQLSQSYPAIEVHTQPVDVANAKALADFTNYIKGLGRPVDLLVNNAGVFIPGQMHTEEEGVLEKMIETNLYSAYRMTRAVVRGMVAHERGHIFNICSTASIMPYVNGGSYCISKFAMLGMSKVLREEMKTHGVKVTAIMPGATLTASWEGVDLPASRFMKPEDVADALWSAYNMSESTVVEELLIRPQLGDI